MESMRRKGVKKEVEEKMEKIICISTYFEITKYTMHPAIPVAAQAATGMNKK